MSSSFKKLSCLPKTSVRMSNLVKINEYEFVGATHKYSYSQNHDVLGLYKYNTILNEWNLIIKYPKEFHSMHHRICYDNQNNKIYLCGYEKQMVIFDLNALKIDIHQIIESIGYDPVLIMINNECHIILGGSSEYHYKWNSKLQKLEIIFEFTQFPDGLYEHGVIHIKSQNRLLLLGGYISGEEHCSDEIWEYGTNNTCLNIWKQLHNTELPIEMTDFELVLSKNEDYLILFGGLDKEDQTMKNIFILNLREMRFYSSKITLMTESIVSRTVLMNNENNRVILKGFIRNISKEYDMNIPSELVQLLHAYFDRETIYLLGKGINLYSIEMNEILDGKHENLSTQYFEDSESEERVSM